MKSVKMTKRCKLNFKDSEDEDDIIPRGWGGVRSGHLFLGEELGGLSVYARSTIITV